MQGAAVCMLGYRLRHELAQYARCTGTAATAGQAGCELGALQTSVTQHYQHHSSRPAHLLQVLPVHMLVAASISKVHSAALGRSAPRPAVTILTARQSTASASHCHAQQGIPACYLSLQMPSTAWQSTKQEHPQHPHQGASRQRHLVWAVPYGKELHLRTVTHVPPPASAAPPFTPAAAPTCCLLLPLLLPAMYTYARVEAPNLSCDPGGSSQGVFCMQHSAALVSVALSHRPARQHHHLQQLGAWQDHGKSLQHHQP